MRFQCHWKIPANDHDNLGPLNKQYMGAMKLYLLAPQFQTDIMTINSGIPLSKPIAHTQSGLYATLEAREK